MGKLKELFDCFIFYLAEKGYILFGEGSVNVFLLIELIRVVLIPLCISILIISIKKLFFSDKLIFDHYFKSRRSAAIFAFFAVICIWFYQSSLNLWENTDDFYISMAVNSVYSRENYCIFINPILAKIIYLIDLIFPKADGMVLLNETLVMIGLWSVFYITAVCYSAESNLVFLLLVLAINSRANIFHLPFTSMTAELGFYGFFVLYAVLSKKISKKFTVIGMILLIFSMLIRYEAFLFLIPFVILILLTDLIRLKDRKEYLSGAIKLFLPAAVLFVICVGTKTAVDRSEHYKQGALYNSYRANIVDFRNKGYDECKEKLEELGISENDFRAVSSMILADRDTVNSEYLENISKLTNLSFKEKYEDAKQNTEFSYIRVFDYATMNQLVIAVFILIAVLLSDTVPIYKVGLVLSYIGAYIICSALIIYGRIVSYVTQAVMFGVWLTIFSFSVNSKVKNSCSAVFKITAVIVAVTFIIKFYPGYNFSPENSVFNAKDSKVSDLVFLDGDDEAFYIWDARPFGDTIKNSYFFKERKLMSREFLSHNIVDGEWLYEQPYYLDYMSSIGMENPMQALINRDHTYYISDENRCGIVLKFLQEHYDENISADKVGKTGDVPVWRFSAN